MMATILTLIILGMVFQGLLAVLNSILDTVGVNSMLSNIPVVGSNLTLIWAYLFVVISDIGGWGYGASTEILGLSDFGMDVGSALAITAFIPVKDAAISALSKGVARLGRLERKGPPSQDGGPFLIFLVPAGLASSRLKASHEHLFDIGLCSGCGDKRPSPPSLPVR